MTRTDRIQRARDILARPRWAINVRAAYDLLAALADDVEAVERAVDKIAATSADALRDMRAERDAARSWARRWKAGAREMREQWRVWQHGVVPSLHEQLRLLAAHVSPTAPADVWRVAERWGAEGRMKNRDEFVRLAQETGPLPTSILATDEAPKCPATLDAGADGCDGAHTWKTLNDLVAETQARRTECDHGIVFDAERAKGMTAAEVQRAFPRLWGPCPKGCGFDGIGYASFAHYIAGDW